MDEMKALTELGADLYPDQEPSPQMRTRALGVAPQTGRSRLVAAAAAAVLLAVGTAVAVSSLAGPKADGGSAQGRSVPTVSEPTGVVETKPVTFTVRTNADGSVTFAATDLVDPAAATQELNAAGVAGRVVNVPDESCSIEGLNHPDLAPDYLPDKAEVGPGESDSVTFRSTDYPPGGGLLLIVQEYTEPGNPLGVAVIVYPYTDADDIPTCLSLALFTN